MPGVFRRAGSHAALVTAAIHLGGELDARIPAADIQSADSLRAVDLVRRDRHQVDVVLDHIDGNLAERLHAIGVEQHAALVADLADLGDRLDHADFIVGVHDADQDRLVGDGIAKLIEIDQAVLLQRAGR